MSAGSAGLGGEFFEPVDIVFTLLEGVEEGLVDLHQECIGLIRVAAQGNGQRQNGLPAALGIGGAHFREEGGAGLTGHEDLICQGGDGLSTGQTGLGHVGGEQLVRQTLQAINGLF